MHFADGFAVDSTSLKDDPRWDDVDAVYRAYWETVARAAAWGRFDVVGHLDLVKKFGRRPSKAMIAAEDEALAAIRAAGLAIELNTSGLRSCGRARRTRDRRCSRAPPRSGIPAHARLGRPRAPRTWGVTSTAPSTLARAAGYSSTLRLSDRQEEALP